MKDKDIKKKFSSVGVKVSFRYAINTGVILSLASDRKSFDINAEHTDMEKITVLSSSKKHKQVLIALEEDGAQYQTPFQATALESTNSQKKLKSLFRKFNKTILPEGTTYSIAWKSPGIGWSIVATTPIIKQKYLIGYDEQHLFISSLKNNAVNTVEAARRSLIPKECVGKKYLRQGEFFFLPIPFKKAKEFIEFKPWSSGFHSEISLIKDNDDSDHVVDGVVLCIDDGRRQLVFGSVSNPRHKTLDLTSFHEVFVANENARFGSDFK